MLNHLFGFTNERCKLQLAKLLRNISMVPDPNASASWIEPFGSTQHCAQIQHPLAKIISAISPTPTCGLGHTHCQSPCTETLKECLLPFSWNIAQKLSMISQAAWRARSESTPPLAMEQLPQCRHDARRSAVLMDVPGKHLSHHGMDCRFSQSSRM